MNNLFKTEIPQLKPDLSNFIDYHIDVSFEKLKLMFGQDPNKMQGLNEIEQSLRTIFEKEANQAASVAAGQIKQSMSTHFKGREAIFEKIFPKAFHDHLIGEKTSNLSKQDEFRVKLADKIDYLNGQLPHVRKNFDKICDLHEKFCSNKMGVLDKLRFEGRVNDYLKDMGLSGKEHKQDREEIIDAFKGKSQETAKAR